MRPTISQNQFWPPEPVDSAKLSFTTKRVWFMNLAMRMLSSNTLRFWRAALKNDGRLVKLGGNGCWQMRTKAAGSSSLSRLSNKPLILHEKHDKRSQRCSDPPSSRPCRSSCQLLELVGWPEQSIDR